MNLDKNIKPFTDFINTDNCIIRLKCNKQCSYKKKYEKGICTRHNNLLQKKVGLNTVYNTFLVNNRFNEKSKSNKKKYKKIKIKIKKNKIKIKKNKIKKIIKLQSIFRKFLIKNNIFYRGKSCYCRNIVNNATDCLSFDEIVNISVKDYFSYTDSNNFIWGFNILTFKELCKSNKKNVINPYNMQPINDIYIQKFNQLLKNIEKKRKIEFKYDKLKPELKLQQRCVKIFQIMDSLKQYTQCEWFLNLNLIQLINFYVQLEDIWNYRAGISNKEKLNYTKNGKLFEINVKDIKKIKNKIKLSNIILDECERLITEGKTVSDKTTGALWVLSALTIVSKKARDALPWLFQAANIY